MWFIFALYLPWVSGIVWFVDISDKIYNFYHKAFWFDNFSQDLSLRIVQDQRNLDKTIDFCHLQFWVSLWILLNNLLYLAFDVEYFVQHSLTVAHLFSEVICLFSAPETNPLNGYIVFSSLNSFTDLAKVFQIRGPVFGIKQWK